VLGHEHVAASSSVQLLEGGLVAITVAAPPCRRRVAAMVFRHAPL
jgi:hypothetical protein